MSDASGSSRAPDRAPPARGVDAGSPLHLLPHRYPFLLVDRIQTVERARRVVGFRRVTGNEWWMPGAGSAMPHTLVLEALAQTGGALVRDLLDGAEQGMAYFLGADRVRFRAAARAGDELRLEVSLLQWKRGICRTRGTATVGGAVVVSAELATVVRGG